jgi:hypothetical protein
MNFVVSGILFIKFIRLSTLVVQWCTGPHGNDYFIAQWLLQWEANMWRSGGYPDQPGAQGSYGVAEASPRRRLGVQAAVVSGRRARRALGVYGVAARA